MHATLMIKPVGLSVGLGHKREISSLSEMHEFLNEWAPSRRRLTYGAAVKALEAARSGECSPQAAREAFVAFAQNAGILWADDKDFVTVKPVVHGFGGYAI
jgi:hypothetical protein